MANTGPICFLNSVLKMHKSYTDRDSEYKKSKALNLQGEQKANICASDVLGSFHNQECNKWPCPDDTGKWTTAHATKGSKNFLCSACN